MSKLKYGSRVKVARVPSKKGGVRIYPWEEWMDPIVGVEGLVKVFVSKLDLVLAPTFKNKDGSPNFGLRRKWLLSQGIDPNKEFTVDPDFENNGFVITRD